MTNPSKQKGTKFETDVLNYLRNVAGEDISRLALVGTEDEGDLAIRYDDLFEVIECKAEVKYDIPRYLREIQRERINFAKHRGLALDEVSGTVIMKLKGQPIGKCAVIGTVDDYFGIDS